MVKNAHFFVLLLAVILVPPFVNAKASSSTVQEDPEKTNLERDSSNIRSWLNTTFATAVQGNASQEKKCDDSQEVWARNALRFKNKFPQLRNLGSTLACTETLQAELGKPDLRVNYFLRPDAEQLSRNGYTGLRFRFYYKVITRGADCSVYSGTFIKSVSQLYFVVKESKKSPTLQQVPNNNASRYYIHERREFEPSYSLFMSIPDIDKVPGYKTALDAANKRLSVEEDRVQEISISNTAILLLPLLLSFLPLCLIQSPEDVSRIRMVAYILVTDILSAVPLLIKGGELISISSKSASPSQSVTFKTGNAELQLVELWTTICSKTLPAFYIGGVFLYVGVWAIVVGFLTEFIAWRYVKEKPRKKFVTEEKVKQLLLEAVTESQATASSHPVTSQVVNNPSATPATAPESVADNTLGQLSIPDNDSRVLVFFFLGVIFILVLPFHFYWMFRPQFFKVTKKGDYLHKTGIMVFVLNTLFVVAYLLHISVLPFLGLIDFCLIVIAAVQRCGAKCFNRSNGQEPATNDEWGSGELKYFFSGFVLGVLTCLASTFYAFCLPRMSGETKKIFFKYGCALGSLHGLLILELIAVGLSQFFSIKHFGFGPYIFLFNVFYVVILILTETEILSTLIATAHFPIA